MTCETPCEAFMPLLSAAEGSEITIPQVTSLETAWLAFLNKMERPSRDLSRGLVITVDICQRTPICAIHPALSRLACEQEGDHFVLGGTELVPSEPAERSRSSSHLP